VLQHSKARARACDRLLPDECMLLHLGRCTHKSPICMWEPERAAEAVWSLS